MRYLLPLMLLAIASHAQTVTTYPVPAGATAITVTVPPVVTTQPAPTVAWTFPPVVVPPTPALGYQLTPPPQDANGWTIIPALQSGRNIYVSSSTGNDANVAGLSGRCAALSTV